MRRFLSILLCISSALLMIQGIAAKERLPKELKEEKVQEVNLDRPLAKNPKHLKVLDKYKMPRYKLSKVEIKDKNAPQKEIKIQEVNLNKPFAENLKHLEIPDQYKLPEIEIGDKNAPHTLIVYSSFSCSHCCKFHRKDMPKLKKYIRQKKLKICLRNYLDDLGALEAAILMRIFYKKGKSAKKIYKAIFAKQENWMNSRDPRRFLKDIFVSMGCDSNEVKHYLDHQSKEYKATSAGLMKGQQEAMFSFGITSVPAFIIDKKVYVGYLNASEIEEKLNLGDCNFAKKVSSK